jgi:hypothetical protein
MFCCDKLILSFISGKEKDIQEIKEYLKKIKIKLTLPTIRTRLDELHQNCWAWKNKQKESKKIIYSAPVVFQNMIKLIESKDIL